MKHLTFCLIVASLKQVEYKLWKNYGQIIPDTSLNTNHAVNGVSFEVDPNDCLYSDRGLYFSHEISSLKLPPNDRSQKLFTIQTPYTVIIWLNNFKNEGRYFSRLIDQKYLIIKSFGQNTIGYNLKILSEDTKFINTPDLAGN